MQIRKGVFMSLWQAFNYHKCPCKSFVASYKLPGQIIV